MSVAGLSFAFSVELRPATLKFLLVALGDYADHGGFAYPSVEALAFKTCLDRKTVISGLKELEELGMLIDTERRVGRTKQVKVYRINGLDMGERHYVYRCEDVETGEFYIGVRTCHWNPEHDAAYMGSGSWPLKALRAKRQLRKTVIGVYASRRDAELAELQTIHAASSDPLCRNKLVPRSVPPTELLHHYQSVPPAGPFRKAKGPVHDAKGSRLRPERVPSTGHGTVLTLRNEEGAALAKTKNADDPKTREQLAAVVQQHVAALEAEAVAAGFRRRKRGELLETYRQRLQEHMAGRSSLPASNGGTAP